MSKRPNIAELAPTKNGVVLLRDAIKHKTPKEVPFPAGLRNKSEINNDTISKSSAKDEKEISSEIEGGEVEN